MTEQIDITRRYSGMVELQDNHPNRACLEIAPIGKPDSIATLYVGYNENQYRDENNVARGDDERMANGAFMVLAWNTYDANQETIRQQAEQIKALREALENIKDKPVDSCIYDIADDALKLAKGE